MTREQSEEVMLVEDDYIMAFCHDLKSPLCHTLHLEYRWLGETIPSKKWGNSIETISSALKEEDWAESGQPSIDVSAIDYRHFAKDFQKSRINYATCHKAATLF